MYDPVVADAPRSQECRNALGTRHMNANRVLRLCQVKVHSILLRRDLLGVSTGLFRLRSRLDKEYSYYTSLAK
jgi:hypothetical protein